MEFITGELTPWHWMTAGVVLCALELIGPTTLLLWPGIAALITGLITLLIPILGWQLQVALFAVLAVGSTIAGRAFFKRNNKDNTHSRLNRRTDSYIGRTVTLVDAIVNGVGGALIDKTRWRVVGPDTPAGTQMRVTGIDGASLIVEPIAEQPATKVIQQ